MKKARLYTRVSTDEQAKYGLSLEAQLDELKEYCRINKYQIEGIYSDEGISGGSIKKRKAFQNMINDANKWDIILFTKLDRFSRNLLDALITIRDLEAKGVSVRATQQDIDTTTTQGRTVLQMMLVIAQNEREMTSDRITAVFTDRIKKGYTTSGKTPFGYIKEDHKYIPDPETAKLVVELFTHYDNCGSLNSTGKWWNTTYPEYKRSPKNIKRRLKNTFYIGVHPSGNNDHYCEPIVDKELFDRVQQKLNSNVKKPHSGRTYLFTGLCRCPECGGKLTPSAHKRKNGYYILYRCNRYYNEGICSNKSSISEQKLEQSLLADLRNRIENPDVKISISDKKTKNKNVSKMSAIKSKIERLKELYIEGLIDKSEFDTKYNSFTKQLNEIEVEITEISNIPKIQNELKNVSVEEIYDQLTKENKSIFWHKYIKYIIAKKDDLKIVYF